MDSARPLDTCLHPVRVQTADGVHYFPCGHCSACLKSKNSKWQHRLFQQCITPGIHTLFVTLTYSNEHLPLVNLDFDSISPDFCDVVSVTRTKFKRGLSTEYYRDDVTDYFIDRFGYDFVDLSLSVINSIPHFVQSRKSKTSITYDTSKRFGICLRQDIQDFVKRLRSILSRCPSLADKDTSFTYFICSEYGPGTFRPHYHGLLFFHDRTVAQLCNDSFILDAWSKCDTSCFSESEPISKFVTNKFGAASYVSKYVTCCSDLPAVLDYPAFRPFHLQSISTPIGSEAVPVTSLPDMVSRSALFYDYEFKDKVTSELVSVHLPYPPSFWNRIFPRFSFGSLLSPQDLLHCFRVLYSFRGSTPPNLVKEVASLYSIGSVDFHCSRISVATDYSNFFRPRSFTLHSYDCSVVTYSDRIRAILNSPNWVYYFLFGIPQNRSASLKIIRSFSIPDLSNPRLYYDFYNLFFSKYESCKIESQLNYFEHLFRLNDFQPSPTIISLVYPHFYTKLFYNLSSYGDVDFFFLDFLTVSNFGLSFASFYNGDYLSPPDFRFVNRSRAPYLDELRNYFNARRVKVLYNHNKFLDF